MHKGFHKVVDHKCRSLAVHVITLKLLGVLKAAKECVAPLLPTHIYICTVIYKDFLQKKRGSAGLQD